MTKIVIAKAQNDFEKIAHLADVIWREHYIPIVGVEQIDYMLEKYQSAHAISSQVKEGFAYFLITYNHIPAGYLAIKHEEHSLFLSKIYVLKAYRGEKIGKSAMLFVEEQAREKHCEAITLTVNKQNVNSMAAYEKLGFINMGSVVKDIGHGFVMDDYKMVKPLAV